MLGIEYYLRETSREKPTMSIDDLLQLLHHHWALRTDYYTIERQRVQHALIILMMV